jgi:formyl-CoA transferase
VHTSLLEAMVSLMDFQAARWLIDGDVPKQAGNEHPTLPATGTFRTSDGHVNVAVVRGFDRFFAAIGVPRLAADPRFQDSGSRNTHRADLNAAIQEAMLARTTREWVEAIGEEFACGPVLSMDEVFADDQVRELQMTRTVQHPERGPIEVLRLPLTFSETPASVRSGPATRGAHSLEVLGELGYDRTTIDELIATGVVAGADTAD